MKKEYRKRKIYGKIYFYAQEKNKIKNISSLTYKLE
jgi:hypothetical protein